ncbi:response regulator [Oceanidesulfovibrio marinus]|uniref:Response regulator n=1 Tax=Oceanidesulfovibrio marinus TaxID=370038 RepID=A0ABX6NEC9_9BACT|nr:response regulator [Oceanidesulfovibrio marinus]QJT08954.1 response regulator [Oceanidesulfovibrio marinus]
MEHAISHPAFVSRRQDSSHSHAAVCRWDSSCIDDLDPADIAGTRFLVVSASQYHARTDRRLLIRLGAVDVSYESSGVRAARRVVSGKVDCVILDGSLSDMSGLEFVRLIRLHPRTALMPVILASMENDRSAVMEALASGISGYLIRPYSMVGLARQIGRILETPAREIEEGMGVSRAAFKEALARYKTAPAAAASQSAQAPDTIETLLAEVDELLRVNALDAAYEALNPLVRAKDALVRGEAHLRLADIYRRKANPAMRKDSLAQAGACFQDAGDLERAAECFAMLQELNPSEPSPDELTARNCLRNRDYRGAARIYARMLAVTEPDAVSRSISRACMFTADPVTNARLVCNELGVLRGEESEDIYKKIVGPPSRKVEELPEYEERARGIVAEVFAVARYTMRAYRGGSNPGVSHAPELLKIGA